MTPLVWYAAYGSNLWRARLLVYLTGGPVPHSPAGREQAGGRDPSPPLDHRPLELPGHRLLFARSSAGWGGGGVGFLAPHDPPVPGPGPVGALGRIWLVTGAQFDDIAAQENGRPPGSVTVDPAAVGPGRPLEVCDGWYGRVLHLGAGPGGHPVLTVTCPDPGGLPLHPAHPSYLRVVGLGLMETWGLDPAEAAAHLAAAPGNHGTVDPAALAADLALHAAP